MATRFQRDTAVARRSDGDYDARIDRGWWIVRGPNGGYIAAIVLRALIDAVGDERRHPRSLTVHYTAPPVEGAARVSTRIERQGRSVTTATARLVQGERVCAFAIASFSPAWPGPEVLDRARPVAPPPEQCKAPVPSGPSPMQPIPMNAQYETRWAIGAPPRTDGDQALAGGWIRFSDQQVVDACAAAAICDAWVPPIFTRLSEPMVVPTVDLTVHFRSTLPTVGAAGDDWLLCMFRTTVLQEGFLEEDGEVWSRDGRLLAHSRQLAVAMPLN